MGFAGGYGCGYGYVGESITVRQGHGEHFGPLPHPTDLASEMAQGCLALSVRPRLFFLL